MYLEWCRKLQDEVSMESAGYGPEIMVSTCMYTAVYHMSFHTIIVHPKNRKTKSHLKTQSEKLPLYLFWRDKMFIAVEEQASQVPMTLSSDEAKKVIAKARDMARAPRAPWVMRHGRCKSQGFQPQHVCVCVFIFNGT